MASLKAEKPAGSQLFGQVKKDPPKAAGEGASKAKPAPKKTEQKPKETKKKAYENHEQFSLPRVFKAKAKPAGKN